MTHPWHSANSTTVHQITATTSTPGKVFPYPIDALPDGIQEMPGIKDAYISGYCDPVLLKDSLSAIGEIVVEREVEDTGKGYVFAIARTENEVFYTGPYKPRNGHYFKAENGIDLNALFGKIDKYP